MIDLDDDEEKPRDAIWKRQQTQYEFTHLMVEVLGVQEAMLRYVIVHSFTTPRVS